MPKSKGALPDDLISITRAASLAERSERTIRRWASTEAGKLQRWEGQPPPTGGPAPVLVSERDLMNVLMVSGQSPRITATFRKSNDSTSTRQLALDNPAAPPDSVQIALLQGQLEVAKIRAELAATSAAHDGLAQQIQDLRSQVEEQRRRWEIERSDHRLDLDAERDRSRALEAELRALRELHGVSWWQKLLGGPTAPALEAK